MNKRIITLISFVLAFALFGALAFSVSANNTDGEDIIDSETFDTGFYSVDVLWDDLSFSYSSGGLVWNPNNHLYEIEDNSEWTDYSGKVSVINYSDDAVSISIEFKAADTPNGTATLVVENPSFILEGTRSNQTGGATENFSSITAKGTPKSDAMLGKIVVTIGVIEHEHIWSDGVCTKCGEACTHNFNDGTCSVCGYKKPYIREGDIIYFGEYPQALKANSVTVSDTAQSNGYYLGSDNAYYAKVSALPYESGYKFSTEGEVTKGEEYYFKVEPLKWRILSESNGNALIVCESIIDVGRYDDNSNNYKDSEIRTWLNSDFYNNAFDNLEQKLIQIVSVDNSLSSTGYAENSNICENTDDKVYLLSYADVTNSAYGFGGADARERAVSDYSVAKGAWISTNKFTQGNGLWMLRTPNDTYSHFIRECNQLGEITDGGTNLTSTFYGIVPAVTIKL